MSSELTAAIQQIAEEKGLAVDSIVETIELALAAAYRKDFGNKLQNIKVEFDLETAESKVFDIKTVVEDALFEEYEKEQEARKEALESGEEVETPPQKAPQPETVSEESEEEEEVIKFNPKTMISLSAAHEIDAALTLEDELKQELEVPQDYGRMAAQTAKQVIIQKIREAERESIYELFKEKEHELITGMIQRVEPKVVLVDIDKTTAIMPISEQIREEKYRIGSRMKFYVKDVNQSPKGPEIIVSRNHPEMIRKLFVIEVPEISAGTVVIKAIAREAGSRSKIAVISKEENIDPIGACVGQRGARVQTIINELGGEKIDIIEHSEDVTEFIANALSPAKILRVETTDEEHQAQAFVNEDQLSLAIGKGGQNVRLAARLTGWRLDIIEEGSGEVKITSTEDGGSEESDEAAASPAPDTEDVPNDTPEESSDEPTEAPEPTNEELVNESESPEEPVEASTETQSEDEPKKE